MEFEFDPCKSASNEDKHGINFVDAQQLWDDEGLVRFDIEYGGESRFGIVARLLDGCWTAVCTTRGEKIRIISVRRSTKGEVSFYDKANNDR